MNPEQPISMNPRDAKHLRMIITIGLVLVLVGILAAYIYYGMRLASQSTNSENLPVQEAPVAPNQAEILKALEAAPAASPEETEAMLEALDAAPSTPSVDRQAILDALQ